VTSTRATALVFVVSWAVFYALYMPLVLLFDTDSYLHLAIAREYGQQGMLQSLDWARFSVMHDGYGDKELLFHLFLAPFAGWMDAETGGKLALALLNALIATTLFHLGSRAQGRWGGLAALLVFGLSGTFALRMIRLRPELLSVLLLLWIVMAAGQRRYRTLAALTFAYAYAHTAVQALFGLCIGWFVWNAWAHRRWCWQLLAYPAAAIGLAFVLHPQFPANLDIWVVQNVDFFKYKSVLDVGEEFRSLTTKELLTLDWAWAAALVAMVWSRKRDDAEAPPREIAPAFWIAALPFGVLFAMMSRFSTLFVPLATLGLLFELRERGFVLGATTQLPGGRAIRTTVVALLIGALGCTWTGRQVVTVLENGGSMAPANRDAFVDFDANLPDGATVAAPWGLAGDLVFWAPQGLYLNLFDPVFMAVAHPEKHRAQAAIFAGAEPDTPLTAHMTLDSEYIAYPIGATDLDMRLLNDPRIERLSVTTQVLCRVHENANKAFVLDWKDYPRHEDPVGRAIEGYVDGTRVGPPDQCRRFEHHFSIDRATSVTYEFAPSGPSQLWIDSLAGTGTPQAMGAVLGRGLRITKNLAPGPHVITVATCPSGGRLGFYLVRR